MRASLFTQHANANDNYNDDCIFCLWHKQLSTEGQHPQSLHHHQHIKWRSTSVGNAAKVINNSLQSTIHNSQSTSRFNEATHYIDSDSDFDAGRVYV